MRIAIGRKKYPSSEIAHETRARPFAAPFFFARPAVFIESFGEGRQLVIGAESPRRRPHRSLLHLAARRFIRAIFARVESGKQGWYRTRGRESARRGSGMESDETERYSREGREEEGFVSPLKRRRSSGYISPRGKLAGARQVL